MIGLSDVFNLVGQNGVIDVASSLALQGINPDISIPIYEIFYLKLINSNNIGFLVDSIVELNSLKLLNKSCGSITATINLLDMDSLTLLGLLIITTPNTGMNIFYKTGKVLNGDISDVGDEIIVELASLAGIPLDNVSNLPLSNLNLGNEVFTSNIGSNVVLTLVNILFERLMEELSVNLEPLGIHLIPWEELPIYYNELKHTGEMNKMAKYRQSVNAAIL